MVLTWVMRFRLNLQLILMRLSVAQIICKLYLNIWVK